MNKTTQLAELLTQMQNILDELLKLETEKSDILEKGSIDDLNELMNTEQALIMKCSSYEKQRKELCDELGSPTITELFEKQPELKGEIEPIHRKMIETIDEIRKSDSLNIKLIDTRLKILRFMTSQLGMSPDNTTYGRDARIK